MLAKLVMTSPRPTILCADELSTGSDILVAYDGSLPSMHAVQMFVLLGMATDSHVHVTSIDAGQELAVRKTCGAAAYLESHGFSVEANPIASSAAPAEVICGGCRPKGRHHRDGGLRAPRLAGILVRLDHKQARGSAPMRAFHLSLSLHAGKSPRDDPAQIRDCLHRYAGS